MIQKMIIMPKLCNCSGKFKKQWFVYYSVRDPLSNKMVRIRHYDGFTGLTKEEKYDHARALIEEYTQKLQSGWSPFAGNQQVVYSNNIDYKTVAELFKTRQAANRTLRPILSKYLDRIRSEIAPGSFSTYCSALRIFTIWTEKSMLEDDIIAYNKEVIYHFFDYLINTRQLSGKSITKYKDLLLKFFNYCIDRKLIKKNPVVNIPRCNRINDQAPRPILKADIDIFRKELVKDPELLLAIQFEFYCALRPGHEIREMQIKNIDLAAGIIRVTRSLAKNRTERIVTIPYQFLTELRRIFAEWQLAGINMDREFYLFGNNGIPGTVHISKNHLTRKFIIIRKKLCMPTEYKLYSWKHTAAVLIDESLIPSKDLSRHMGHSSISVTDEYLKNKKPGLSNKIRDNYPDLWEKHEKKYLTTKDITVEMFSN